jgi:hypothetical protein
MSTLTSSRVHFTGFRERLEGGNGSRTIVGQYLDAAVPGFFILIRRRRRRRGGASGEAGRVEVPLDTFHGGI